VVKREGLKIFFTDKLAQLGLNDREASEFIEYWVSRMVTHPYYLVYFLPETEIEEIAPWHMTPAPDTLIRVMMDYLPLDKPLQIAPEALSKPQKRQGFTAVEWGGLQR
jgi:hypothetical protein